MRPAGLVAQHERLGLRAVEQAQRHAGEGGMEERALALDQVPAVVVARRRELLDRAGDEIGDDGIDRHALAGDQDAGLAGRAEIGGDAPLAQRRGSSASVAYILPTEQSVPTVSRRLPGRG